jgi:peptidoglycan hydrolase-like protein with peptidoglycan-binding domain
MTKTKLSLVFLCLTAIGAVLFVVASAQSDPAPTTPALSSFTFSRDLSMGDTGPDVSVLQGFLISDGFLDISTSTGYFGPLTEAAVANWQASVELPDTGYFGPLSRAAMAIVSASPYGRDLTIGDTGSDVSMLQNFLISKEFLTIATATGYFGPLTEEAVLTWQVTAAVPATGYFGPLSRAAIEADASTTTTTTISVPPPVITALPTPTTTVVTLAPPPISVPISTPTATVSVTPPVSSALNDNFGLSVGDSLLGLSSSALNQELDGMVSLGVGWVRFDMEWDNIQSNNSSTFDWSQIDPVVAALNAHHIKILAILDYTPTWAGSSTCPSGSNFCAPADPAQFGAFAQAAAQRYSSQGVSDWEIWNEPNNAGFWGPTVDCNAYTAILKDAYTAIKAVEPNSTVITGGLSPAATDGTNMSPTDFLSCIYAAGGEGYFDAVGDHPYTFPQMPSDDNGGAWDQMSATNPSLRSIMTANGDADKQIWVTEYGTPTNGPDSAWYVSEAQQAQMVTDAFTTYSAYSWGGPFFWYTYKDGGTDTSTNENFFGLLRADGSTKPAYTTLQNLLTQ